MFAFAPLVGAKQTLDGLRLSDEDRFDVLCAPDNPHMAGMPPRLTSRDELFKKAVVDNRGLRNFRLVRGEFRRCGLSRSAPATPMAGAKHRDSVRQRGLSLIPANVCRFFALSSWTRSSSLRDHHPDGSVVFFEMALEGGGLSLRVFRSLRVLGEAEYSSREFAC
jgi:hypothetical protein